MKKYARIFKYLSHYKGKVGLYILFILLSVIFSIVSIGMLMPFLDLIFKDSKCNCPSTLNTSSNPIIGWASGFLNKSLGNNTPTEKIYTLGIICIMILVSILFKNLFLYLSYYVLTPVKNNIIKRLRSDIYSKLLQLPIGYFTEQRKGDIMSRMTTDIGEVEGSVVGTLEGLFRDPLTIIVSLVALFLMSPTLTLIILIAIPIMGFVIGSISKSLRRHSKDVAETTAESFSVLEETLGGLRIIKAFNVETLLRNRFEKNNNAIFVSKNKISFRRDLASPISELLSVGIFVGLLYFGGSLVLNKALNIEASLFLTFLAMFYQIVNPAKSFSTSFSNMQKGTAAMQRIEEILNAPVAVNENKEGQQLTAFNDKIEFKNVTFKYDDVTILKNINLVIAKGKTIALVGSSGAGKSTLADLIPRFHDITAGELLIDGVNIKEYATNSVRNLISIVTQEPILFNDTIGNNIALGMPNATTEQVTAAAQVANAHQFIIKKEAGYDTNIGDRGTKLSGGERQRLTIARAVLKNPPILILDEATSSLDTESEKLVQDAINNMMQNRTSIVIAHRLSTIRNADEIIVLQKGEIVERGTHNELIAADGFYKKLVTMQEVK